MLKNSILWTALMLSFFSHISLLAQSGDELNHPVVGKPCPDFILTNILDSKETQLSPAILKGRPFIMDFFATGCTACFASFPELNDLNKEFSEKVRLILIGKDDKYIRPAYEVYKKKKNLNLPHVYDSSIFTQFGVWGVPYEIWVNAEGLVVAFTSTEDITKENLEAFYENKAFEFHDPYKALSLYMNFDRSNPFAIDSIGRHDSLFLQRSLVAAWKRSMGNESQSRVEDYIKLKLPLQIVGWPLSALYKFAYTNRLYDWDTRDSIYYGNYHYSPIYELTDSSQFKFEWSKEENMFCYSQILPKVKSNPEDMLSIMRNDLYNAFGYHAMVETRKMPYLRLIKKNGINMPLKSKGGDKVEESFINGVNFRNVPISSLVNVISDKSELVSRDMPLIDETGINYPIDIRFSAMMIDITDISNELSKQGLEIVPGMKDMKVLVIKDKTDQSQISN